MQVDERYVRLNERLEGVNKRLKSVLFESFLVVEQCTWRLAAKTEGMDALAALSSSLTEELLLFFKRKRFDLKAAEETRCWEENAARAQAEFKRAERVAANLLIVFKLAEEGELPLAVDTWRAYKTRTVAAGAYPSLSRLLESFESSFEVFVEQKAREQLQAGLDYFAQILPRFEAAIGNAARVGVGGLLETSSLQAMLATNYALYGQLGRKAEALRIAQNNLESRLNNIVLKNLVSRALSAKLIECFCFFCLHEEVRREVFRGQLPALQLEKHLPAALQRLTRKLHESPAADLSAVINLLNFLGGHCYELHLSWPFLLFESLLESAISLYVEKSAEDVFVALATQPPAVLLEQVVVTSHDQFEELCDLGFHIEEERRALVEPLCTSVLVAFRELARLFPRFLAFFRDGLKLDAAFKKLSTYSDHGVQFIAALGLSFLKDKLGGASASLSVLASFLTSLVRLENDVLGQFITEKFRRDKLFGDLCGEVKGAVVEMLVVRLKADLGQAISAFVAANFHKAPASAKPRFFVALAEQLAACAPALVHPENLFLLAQLSGSVDQTLLEGVWKALAGPGVKSFTVVDLHNLSAEIGQITQLLRRLQTAPGVDVALPLYHEELLHFCDLFLKYELRAVATTQELTAQLQHTDLRVVRQVLRKFEEIRPVDVPFIAEKEVRKLLALLE